MNHSLVGRYDRAINILSILLVAAGLWTVWHLNRDAFPKISHDRVIVQVSYPGTSPEQIERLILLPIESELRTVDHIEEVSGVAVEGLGIVVIEIDPNTTTAAHMVPSIQQVVDQIEALPDDLPDPPQIFDVTTRTTPILEVALSGELSEFELQEEARRLSRKILDLPDVARVIKNGWRPQQIWVELEPSTLLRNRISLTEVSDAIRAYHVDLPGGLLNAPTHRVALRTQGVLASPADVGAILLRTNERGDTIHLRDVATIRWAVEESATLTRARGTRAINLVIVKKERGDAIRMVDQIKDVLETFRDDTDPRLQISIMRDFSFFIRRRLNVLKVNGGLGLFLVALTLLLFLSPKTALAAAIGIPIAGLTAVAILGQIGASINLLTMFGLIMVIGMLVDEDLVIAENIHRHLEAHDNPAEAVIQGTREMRRPMIATALTTIAAFIPLLFMGGMIGKFIVWIPIIVIIVLACSLLEALFILPSHLHFLATRIRIPDTGTRAMAWFSRLRDIYRRHLRIALRYRRWVVGAGVSLILGAIIILKLGVIPFHLFPQRGIEVFFVRVEAPVGTPLEETERRMRPIEEAIATLSDTELDTFAVQVGLAQEDPSDPFTTRGSHLGQATVYLTPSKDRERSAEDIQQELREKVGDIPGLASIRYEMIRHGPPVGKPIEIRASGPDIVTLRTIASRVQTRLGAIKGVRDIKDDFTEGKPEIAVEVDTVAASRAGLDYATVARAVGQAFKGERATTIRTMDDTIDVIVRLPEAARNDLSNLDLVQIPTPSGHLVPLRAVATPRHAIGTQAIRHLGGQRVITITAELDEQTTSTTATMHQLQPDLEQLREDYPAYDISLGGEAEETATSLSNLALAAAIAALLILGILLATLNSFRMALVVLTTIPLGLVGVVIGFLIEGEDLSFLALLGIVGMAGIIVDVAIILLDLVRRQTAEGMPLMEAVEEAAFLRFRPIILVMLTTVLGIIPTAYGIGGSDPFIQPMALAMNWGLSVATLLSIFWVPCLFMVLEDIREALYQRKAARQALTLETH